MIGASSPEAVILDLMLPECLAANMPDDETEFPRHSGPDPERDF